MGEEKDKSQNETPSSSVDAENQNHNHHGDDDENQKPEAARNEEQCVEHTEKPAKPDEDEGRTASDDHQETTSGGGDHQEEEGEKIEAGDGEEEGATTKNEDGEEGGGEEERPRYLPPDLSKVSEEVDQYISDNDTLLESRGGAGGAGDDDESSKSSPLPDEVPIYVEQFALLLEDLLQGYNINSGGEAAVKWRELEEEDAASLLEGVNRICRLYTSISQFYSPERQKYAKSISRVGGVLHRAMRFVEEEFRSCLDDYKFPDPPAPPEQQDPASEDPAPDDPASGDPASGNDETQENKDEEEEKEKEKEENDSSGESQQPPAEEPPEETTPPPPPPDFPGYPEEMVSKLNRLAKAMIFGGYETECCQVYFLARRNALEETLRGKLGFEGYSIDDVQKMNWETAETSISTWMAAFKHSATVLFSCERKLADAVFNDCPQLSTTSEAIFIGLSGGLIVQFLIFPEAIAMTKRSAEKLFKFLDLYETLRDNLPTAYENFPPDYITELKAEAALTRGRLGEAMVGIFSELENSIQSDSSKTPVPGGAVHPLTRYTMNYLKLAGDYKETLEQVFKDHWKIDSATGSDFDYNSEQPKSNKPPTAPKQSPFELQIRKVMELLDANLELKSKLYKDLPLCSIFLMNNGRYILQKVLGSPQITELMGDQWARKQSQEVRQYHKTYQRETWGRLLTCLSMEGLMSVHGKVHKPVLKERFKTFNLVFDEIHRTQSSWVISDEQLESEIRISIVSMVIPAYRSFLARYSQIFTPGRQTEKYIKYQAEDIENYIDELFDGKR